MLSQGIWTWYDFLLIRKKAKPYNNLKKSELSENFGIFVSFVVECLKGTYETNCETKCPDNMYGQLCSQECQCKRNQMCDRISGCIGISVFIINFDYKIIYIKTA